MTQKRVKTPIFSTKLQFFGYFPGRDFCDTNRMGRIGGGKKCWEDGDIKGFGYFSILYMVLIFVLDIFLYMDSSTISYTPPGLFFIGL